MRVISRDAVSASLTPSLLIGTMRDAFLALHHREVTAPNEFHFQHPRTGDVHIKGAYVPAKSSCRKCIDQKNAGHSPLVGWASSLGYLVGLVRWAGSLRLRRKGSVDCGGLCVLLTGGCI